jgi:hypothetical protein
MNDNQLTTLWVGSFRYYLGRQSYAVSDFCELLIQEWPTLPDRLKDLIVKELDNAFLRDDQDRSAGQGILPLGMDCDRKQWENVRRLYHD